MSLCLLSVLFYDKIQLHHDYKRDVDIWRLVYLLFLSGFNLDFHTCKYIHADTHTHTHKWTWHSLPQPWGSLQRPSAKLITQVPGLDSVDSVSSSLCVFWCRERIGLDLSTAWPGVHREQADWLSSFNLTRSQRQEWVGEGEEEVERQGQTGRIGQL